MNIKNEELLNKINEIINNSGIGYLKSYPEDDFESRRDWDSLHDDWSNAIYGLLDLKDIILNS